MKLIYCPLCQDVVKLRRAKTECECTGSWGYYKPDGLNAVIGGASIPLGFNNATLWVALNKQPENGMGERYDAFVIPKVCPTIVNVGHEPQDAPDTPSANWVVQWLEDMHTLHRVVEAYYCVDGYIVTVTHDDAPISQDYKAPTLLEAYAECSKDWSNGKQINPERGSRK